MSLDFYDVVRVDGPLAPEEIRGQTGYVCGKSVDDEGEVGEEPVWGVFLYDIERVWCVDTAALVPLGYQDEIAKNRTPAASIRVNQHGDIVD